MVLKAKSVKLLFFSFAQVSPLRSPHRTDSAKQIVHLRRTLGRISEMHDETPIGGVATSPEKQNEELANLQKNAIENSGVGTDDEEDLLDEDSDNSAADASGVSDSEPDAPLKAIPRSHPRTLSSPKFFTSI